MVANNQRCISVRKIQTFVVLSYLRIRGMLVIFEQCVFVDVYNFQNIALGLACLALLVNCKHHIAYSWGKNVCLTCVWS